MTSNRRRDNRRDNHIRADKVNHYIGELSSPSTFLTSRMLRVPPPSPGRQCPGCGADRKLFGSTVEFNTHVALCDTNEGTTTK